MPKRNTGYCQWCNGDRLTLPLGMCKLHEHAADLLDRLASLVMACSECKGIQRDSGLLSELELARKAIAKAVQS